MQKALNFTYEKNKEKYMISTICCCLDYKDMEQLFCLQAPSTPLLEKGKDKVGVEEGRTY